jgi:hypothetical protein
MVALFCSVPGQRKPYSLFAMNRLGTEQFREIEPQNEPPEPQDWCVDPRFGIHEHTMDFQNPWH